MFQTHVIPPDDDDTASNETEPVEDGHPDRDLPRNLPVHHVKNKVSTSPKTNVDPMTKSSSEDNEYKVPATSFKQEDDVPIAEDEKPPDFEDPAHKLLSWHCRLGHLPFKKI